MSTASSVSNSSSTVPVSTIRPEYITLTRSHIPAAMPRSWVIIRTAVWNSSTELDQLQDLRLDRHVQGGRGFVRQDELRVARQRYGDHDALAHPAGELVRIVLESLARSGMPTLPRSSATRSVAAVADNPMCSRIDSAIW